MILNNLQKEIEKQALAFARSNKKKIAKRITSKEIFTPEDEPVSVFMAGSPGAGKTEASKELLASLASEVKILRVDPDELRTEFPEYTGDNSFLFQGPVSILVEKIHDFALKQKQSFLLDGTLASFDVADRNIERSLKKDRLVQILYVYQDPMLAWEFVQARECLENRRILPEVFVNQYFDARESVNRLKSKYGKELRVDLLLKNIDNSNRTYKANIDKIDNHVQEKYNPAALIDVITFNLR